MKIAITGHTNIEKAIDLDLSYDHGQKYNKEAFDKVYKIVEDNLKLYCFNNKITFNELVLISGMARGIDEIFAILAIRNDLGLILSIPGSISWHKNRSLSRGMRAQAVYYDRILGYKNILEIVEVQKTYNGGKYHFVNMARNQHMVDISDGVFSFKSYDSTGTDDCINRATKSEKYLGNLFTL